jgi:hypothetical protein
MRLRLLSAALACLALSSAIPSAARAAAIYTYQGNPFTFFLAPYDGTMALEVELHFANPLAPNLAFAYVVPDVLAFGYFDGVKSFPVSPFDPDDYSNFFLRVSTNAVGDIVGWNLDVTLSGTGDRIDSDDFDRDRIVAGNGLVVALTFDVPGSWTLVPEPGTGLLIGLGLVAFGARGRNRAF